MERRAAARQRGPGAAPALDEIDRRLLAALQADAAMSYAELGGIVGLSAGAVHGRVRKLREGGVIVRTTIDVDPHLIGRGVLTYVAVESTEWVGESGDRLSAFPAIEEAHVVAGSASLLLKVRAASPEELQRECCASCMP